MMMRRSFWYEKQVMRIKKGDRNGNRGKGTVKNQVYETTIKKELKELIVWDY